MKMRKEKIENRNGDLLETFRNMFAMLANPIVLPRSFSRFAFLFSLLGLTYAC
jgi:hypothetical protein